MKNDLHAHLIELAYEAAVVPELWPKVLHQVGNIASARGIVLLTADPHDVRWVASPDIHDDMVAYVEGRWHERNGRLPRLLAANHAGFLREIDVFDTPEEIQQDQQIREFFRPRGLGWGAGTAIPVPSGDVLIYSVEREYDRGPIEQEAIAQLDALRPHLARAALLSARLGMERAKAATESLAMIGLPAAVLRRGGRLMTTNTLFDRLVPDVMQDRGERLTLASVAADALFAQALAALNGGLISMEVRSIPIAAQDDRPPLIVHLVPIHGAAQDLFDRAVAIVMVTPVVPAEVPTAEVLQGLFDLTPAEARVARGIGEGRTIEAIALAFGTSRETVRNQLKAVLAKTGLRRQVELAGLLAGAKVPPGSRTE
ncbi:helix-turn-helix transcriptional regulator [Bradyrhizobium sp. CCBAU 51753]|uniref:helix-turn-helix transcriptional regulator n=1 Tax=Bradyrhizobium sp. CCBAU 51753 TaxID=1325100 RepID=UPI00188B0FE9|nr:helix-turn-helix transcriptional regulator [Bradyrhizobium sp. CCBAU 51753]QOZ29388.1 helix-turn-helix transcriptional regulator [Bradyrhizobium sp. CCBAU 51753]